MRRYSLLILVIMSVLGEIQAQEAKIWTNRGNSAMEEGDFQEAEKAFENALDYDSDFPEALFNLGNLYQELSRQVYASIAKEEDQAKLQEGMKSAEAFSKKAAQLYEKAGKSASNKAELNKVNYNMGNARLLSGQIKESINAYKEALRNDPEDDDARYNLAYAQHLLKKQQEQQQQNQQEQEQQENQQQNDQEENQQKQDQNQQQEPSEELSKEEAEKMLQALMKQEEDLQDKLKKQQHKAERVKIEKDW